MRGNLTLALSQNRTCTSSVDLYGKSQFLSSSHADPYDVAAYCSLTVVRLDKEPYSATGEDNSTRRRREAWANSAVRQKTTTS